MDHREHELCFAPNPGLMLSLRCVEPIEAATIFQENSNSYSCLKRACQSREASQERERGVPPFARLLEMSSPPELGDISSRAPVRDFRAWALSGVCSRSRRWAALPPASPTPFLKRPNITLTDSAEDQPPPIGQPAQGRPALGPGLQLDGRFRNIRCGSGQGTLGALVTVAMLKASGRGGRMQTHCLLLQAKGQSYLCIARRCRTAASGPFTQVPSAPAVHRTGGTTSSEKSLESGKNSKQREGKYKPKPVRKWRTSCEAASSIKERVPWEFEDQEFPVPKLSQENGSRLASQTPAQDVRTSRQQSSAAETHRTAQICTQCRGERDRSDTSLRGPLEDSGQSSSSVEGEETTSPALSAFVCRLNPVPTNPETSGSSTGLEGPGSAGLPDGLRPKSSPQNIGRFQDLLGDKSPCLGAGGKSDVIGVVRDAGNSGADLSVGDKALKEAGGPSDEDPESNGRGDSVRQGECVGGERGVSCGVPCGHITTEGPQSYSFEEDGLASSIAPFTHLAAGSKGKRGSLAEVEDVPEQMRQSDVDPGVVEGQTNRPPGGTGTGEGVLIPSASVESADKADGRTVTNVLPPACVEHSCESWPRMNLMEGSELSDVWGGGDHRGWVGAQRRGAEGRDSIWRADNSLSRGQDSHALPNPAPPGAFAAPLLGELKQQGGTVANGLRFLDVEQTGDDDFGGFVQAGEQMSWDDCITDFQEVPCATSGSVALGGPVSEKESAHWTFGQKENCFDQSDATWTAFSLEGGVALDPGLGERHHIQPEGQWWPKKAAEKFSMKQHLPFSVPCVFQEVFPPRPSSCPSPNPVPTLRQVLSGEGDSGSLLDGLQDVNRIIGLKYKWAESCSQKLLLQSLHLDADIKGHVPGPRANDSQSAGPTLLS